MEKEMTLAQAKQVLKDNYDSGGIGCPCCGQFVKLYKRKLNTAMARGLISLNNLGDGFHHVSTIMIKSKISPTGSNDFSKLKFYGFIKEQPNEDTAKRTSGMWAITAAGIDFVMGYARARKYLFIYNNTVYHKPQETATTDIIEALGNKFNYQELMNS